MSQDNKVYYVPKDSPVYPNRFDTRIRLRSLTRGLLSPEEVQNYLNSLPDEAANAEYVDLNNITDEDDSLEADETLLAPASFDSSDNGEA